MTIETKYNVGNEVWLKSLGFTIKATIFAINIVVLSDKEVHIRYDLSERGAFYERGENELFRTKEELQNKHKK